MPHRTWSAGSVGCPTHPQPTFWMTPPLCDIPSGCCFFTGPWTVTRSSLRLLHWVAAFCRPLRPVLLLVLLPRSRSPVAGVLGLCWMWHGVPFTRQRRPVVGILRLRWLLWGSFDCFCCPHTSVLRSSTAYLSVFPCARAPGALPRTGPSGGPLGAGSLGAGSLGRRRTTALSAAPPPPPLLAEHHPLCRVSALTTNNLMSYAQPVGMRRSAQSPGATGRNLVPSTMCLRSVLGPCKECRSEKNDCLLGEPPREPPDDTPSGKGRPGNPWVGTSFFIVVFVHALYSRAQLES